MTLRQESGNISAAAVGCDEHRQPLIACLACQFLVDLSGGISIISWMAGALVEGISISVSHWILPTLEEPIVDS